MCYFKWFSCGTAKDSADTVTAGETDEENKISVSDYTMIQLKEKYKDCYADFDRFKEMALDIHNYKINIDSGKLECRYVVIGNPVENDKERYYLKRYTTCCFNRTRLSEFFLQEFSKLKKELKKESIGITYEVIMKSNISSNYCWIHSLQLIAKPLPNKLYFKV